MSKAFQGRAGCCKFLQVFEHTLNSKDIHILRHIVACDVHIAVIERDIVASIVARRQNWYLRFRRKSIFSGGWLYRDFHNCVVAHYATIVFVIAS